MTTALATAYSKGGYRSGEQSVIVVPRFYKPDGTVKGVMYVHGAAADALAIIDPTYSPKPYAVTDAGYPIVAFDFGDPAVASGTTSGPQSFGSDNAITAAGSAKTFLQAGGTNGNFGSGPGAATSKFGIYAGSMGALIALNYLVSLATPSSVCSCVALAIPALNLDDVYQNNKGSYRAAIGSAYGVTYPTAIPNLATHSPAASSGTNLAKLSMPIHIWAASDDPIASITGGEHRVERGGDRHGCGRP